MLSKCQTNVIFPAATPSCRTVRATSGVEDYKEFWYSLVGLGSIGQNFTATARWRRTSCCRAAARRCAPAPVSILGTKLQGLRLLAHASLPPLGTRPAYPAEEPPYKPKVPCYKQTLPNFNGPLSHGPADGSG